MPTCTLPSSNAPRSSFLPFTITRPRPIEMLTVPPATAPLATSFLPFLTASPSDAQKIVPLPSASTIVTGPPAPSGSGTSPRSFSTPFAGSALARASVSAPVLQPGSAASVRPLPSSSAQLSHVLSAMRQVLEQPSPSAVFPSSHCSSPPRMPLPHALTVQSWSQPSPSVALPSSQASPAPVTPSPHAATAVRCRVQPSSLPV